ncbi:MAG: hypothetical protein ABSH09_26595 [Bryobacteraceae bacterium]
MKNRITMLLLVGAMLFGVAERSAFAQGPSVWQAYAQAIGFPSNESGVAPEYVSVVTLTLPAGKYLVTGIVTGIGANVAEGVNVCSPPDSTSCSGTVGPVTSSFSPSFSCVLSDNAYVTLSPDTLVAIDPPGPSPIFASIQSATSSITMLGAVTLQNAATIGMFCQGFSGATGSKYFAHLGLASITALQVGAINPPPSIPFVPIEPIVH